MHIHIWMYVYIDIHMYTHIHTHSLSQTHAHGPLCVTWHIHICVTRLTYVIHTGWRTGIECLIFIHLFLRKSPIINSSFAERDLQVTASYASSPPCMCDCLMHTYESCTNEYRGCVRQSNMLIVLDGYCSTVQGLLDWFEVDLGFTELLFIQIDLCVMCVFALYSPVSLSSCPFFGHPALPPPRDGRASRVSPQSCQSHESCTNE